MSATFGFAPPRDEGHDIPISGIAPTDAAGDHTFALAVTHGDHQAFEILFERYHSKIFATAMRYARVAEDAEDIVQQTFQKAFIHLHQFEGKSSFTARTW